VSRSIGDAYLKSPDFPLQYEPPVPPPFTRGVLSAEPEIVTRDIADTDKFVIFASDGLWEHVSNEEACEIVHRNPRHVSIYLYLYLCLVLS
jgi:pyruvate dehydrogenase phosphatase